MKKVSVIVPVYKVERYIESTVQSVLNQTYQNFELLIVDDGSPDHSSEICQQFSDPRIVLIRQSNRGLAGARNTGVRRAQGAYVAFLDGDDIWLPNKLEKHVHHLESSPYVGLSFSRSEFIDESGNRSGTYTKPKLTEITPPDLLRDNPIGNGSAAVVRREVLDEIAFQDNLFGSEEVSYFDEHFRQAEDLDCWLRIAIKTEWQLEGISDALTLYRVNSGGLSANLLNQFNFLEKVLEKTRTYAPELISEWEGPSRAYLLRYLARSALRAKSSSMAIDLMHRSLISHWQIVLEQPRRTLMTLAAAYLLKLIPRSTYQQIERLPTRQAELRGANPSRRFLTNEVTNLEKSSKSPKVGEL